MLPRMAISVTPMEQRPQQHHYDESTTRCLQASSSDEVATYASEAELAWLRHIRSAQDLGLDEEHLATHGCT